MIKTAVNIKNISPKMGAKAIYFPLKDEVLQGVLFNDRADITIVINGNEILLHAFKGVNSKKIAPDNKIFRITKALTEPVLIRVSSQTTSSIKVFFITKIEKETNNE